MRIIIEANEQERLSSAVQLPEQPAQFLTIDGGAPSEELVQAVASALPTHEAKEGMDAGSPPSWLLEAIQGTSQSRIEGAIIDTNAGSAPNGNS